MDPEKRARRQSFRVFVSELLMVVAVICMVAALAFVVSGYWINSDFTVERQGLLQISSVPTGADVYVDGETAWNQRTNTSKVLSSGEHVVELKKDGYDTWSRTVNIKEGLLYRVHYPRLFLLERKKEAVLNTTSATYATVSPDRNTLLIANNTTEWQLIKLDSDKPESKTLDVSKIFAGEFVTTTDKRLFSGEIVSVDWSSDNEHILMKILNEDIVNWVILNIKNISASINLTKEFAASFDSIEILDDSANKLVVSRGGNLHYIDVGGRQISAVLTENVEYFSLSRQLIVISARRKNISAADADQNPYYIGIIKSGDSKAQVVATSMNPSLVSVDKFYDNIYISAISGNSLRVYDKDKAELVFEKELSFTPNILNPGHDGEFAVASNGSQIASIDMEAMSVTEWSTPTTFDWLDSDMIFSVADGVLNVYDFDGLNHRTLSSNVSAHFPVTVSAEKWLYYFSDGTLVRERIAN